MPPSRKEDGGERQAAARTVPFTQQYRARRQEFRIPRIVFAANYFLGNALTTFRLVIFAAICNLSHTFRVLCGTEIVVTQRNGLRSRGRFSSTYQ